MRTLVFSILFCTCLPCVANLGVARSSFNALYAALALPDAAKGSVAKSKPASITPDIKLNSSS